MIVNSVVTNIQTGGDSDIITTKTISSNYGRFYIGNCILSLDNMYCHFTVNNSSNSVLTMNFNTPNTWRVCLKLKITTTPNANTYKYIFGAKPSTSAFFIPNIYIHTNASSQCHIGGDWSTNGGSWNGNSSYLSTVLSLNTWYYVVRSYDKTKTTQMLSLYDENGTLIEAKTATNNAWYSSNSVVCFGGQGSSAVFTEGYISPTECFIEMNNSMIFGVTNSKTATMGVIT